MAEQRSATFGAALAVALSNARQTQADLARGLGIDPGQVSRWVNNKTRPHVGTVDKIEGLLGVDLMPAFEASLPELELYVAAPITGLGSKRVSDHRDKVAQVVEGLRPHVHSYYWAGEEIGSLDDLQASDLATENNLRRFENAQACLFIQLDEIEGPSGSLIELGLALGMKKKTTIIIREGLRTPFMLKGFQGVAPKFRFLPEARIYPVANVGDAVRLVSRNGRPLLGLT